MNTVTTLTIIGTVALMFAVACGQSEEEIQGTVTAKIEEAISQIPTPVPTATAVNTPTPVPTPTPQPASTPQPMPTRQPTATPQPTPTLQPHPIPTPQPTPTPVQVEVDFAAAPVSGTAPLSVTFVDLSRGDISSWKWNFGDGSTSLDRSPTYEYSLPGVYTVSLEVTGDAGSNYRFHTHTDLIILTQPQLTAQEIYDAVSPSVLCVVVRGRCAGTAWVIEGGLAVTAQHVVGTNLGVQFHTASAGPFTAAVIGRDDGHDIALLAFPARIVNPPPLLTRVMFLFERGTTLYVFTQGTSGVKEGGGIGGARVSSGLFSQNIDFDPPLDVNIMLDAVVVPGASGGPVVASDGNVVGMIRSTDTDGGFSYAVPIGTILDVLPRLKAGEVIP